MKYSDLTVDDEQSSESLELVPFRPIRVTIPLRQEDKKFIPIARAIRKASDFMSFNFSVSQPEKAAHCPGSRG